MRRVLQVVATAAFAVCIQAATLQDVCTTAHATASLPAQDFYFGVTIDPTSLVATPVTNAMAVDNTFYPDAVLDYCNVTFAYSHNGLNDKVHLTYWLPAPANFQGRYLSTGGGGYAINSGNQSLPGGIIYGAVAGITDGGFGSFDTQFDQVFLVQNGTVNWQSLFMFGYEAHHELSTIGKEFTKQFFNMSETKLYSYYQGCSEGGREGWSQVQRFADEWDGVITGAPAFRFAHQQVQHLWSNVVEQTRNYYPPPCELAAIVNLTIAACDSMDGKTDGVVARSDLCKLHFDINSTIGKPYYCPAAPAFLGFPPHAATPLQNGTISAEGVAVANEIIQGMHDLEGRQVYLSYQPAAAFVDAQTQYDNTTESWELFISGLGGEFIERYLRLLNASNVPNLDGVSYDTLRDWISLGWQRYEDTLQTTWPDVTPFQQAGGKVIHFHGESDDSIPPASSVRYHESVRDIMYPGMSYNASTAAMGQWYKLFLVPGMKHCAPNPLQPNGPVPQTNLGIMIDWVEKGIEPTTLNATVLLGQNQGENRQVCAWPLRPFWTNKGTTMECQYDQASINSWLYDLNAFKVPVY